MWCMNERKVSNFLYEELSYKIRGCAFSVYNVLGFGHKEGVYQKALALELEKKNISFEKEKTIPIYYEGKKVGIYRPDFVIDDKILVELKAVSFMPKDYEIQLTYYLKGSDFSLGFLINFGSNKLDIRRRVWTPSYQR